MSEGPFSHDAGHMVFNRPYLYCFVSSLSPMFDNLLESSRWGDSNKWLNLGFGEEAGIIQILIYTLSGALVYILSMICHRNGWLKGSINRYECQSCDVSAETRSFVKLNIRFIALVCKKRRWYDINILLHIYIIYFHFGRCLRTSILSRNE